MKFDTLIHHNGDHIIRSWHNRMEREFPGINSTNMYQDVGKYIAILADHDIPLESHPNYSIIPAMCWQQAERGTPIENVIHSCHLWREIILEEIWRNGITMEDAATALPILHKRIDEVQRKICELYWGYAQQIISDKQSTIDTLHHDRLNLLGKMAASMAHEIKNPLFAIQGFLKLIKNSHVQADIDRYLAIIENEIDGLYGQISSFLRFSRNSGQEETYDDCCSAELIEEVLRLVQPRAVDENVELSAQIESRTKLYLQKNAIQQVLSNLINNSIEALQAAEYPKRVIVRSWDQHDMHYISVTDNGGGIPKSAEKSLFEPFYTTKNNGTGLGLPICMQIMIKHGGDLAFDSRIGETIFTLTIPIGKERQVPDSTRNAITQHA
jgi:two-component system, sporulation sensor kinase D